MGTKPGDFATLADLVDATSGVESSTGFSVESQGQLISFSLKGAQPPFPIYSLADYFLVMSEVSSVAGLTVTVTATLLRTDGVVVRIVQQFLTVGDYVKHDTILVLGEGFLIALTAAVSPGSIYRGQVWVSLGLSRQPGPNVLREINLLQDYLVTNHQPSWPAGILHSSVEWPGALRVVVGTAPTLGNEIFYQMQPGARWRLRAANFNFTASATVANRIPGITFQDQLGRGIYSMQVNDNIQASGSGTIICSTAQIQPTTVSGIHWVPLLEGLELRDGWKIFSQTFGLQAGDQYSAPNFYVEELLES